MTYLGLGLTLLFAPLPQPLLSDDLTVSDV